jgi:hypothetical protein
MDRKLAARLPDAGNAIGFRNVLIHGAPTRENKVILERYSIRWNW